VQINPPQSRNRQQPRRNNLPIRNNHRSASGSSTAGAPPLPAHRTFAGWPQRPQAPPSPLPSPAKRKSLAARPPADRSGFALYTLTISKSFCVRRCFKEGTCQTCGGATKIRSASGHGGSPVGAAARLHSPSFGSILDTYAFDPNTALSAVPSGASKIRNPCR